jgi:hypothetical protein
MKKKICLIRLLLRTDHGCITTNLIQSVLQCTGNIPVRLQPKSLRLQGRHPLGRICLQCFWNSQGVRLAHFLKHGENVNSALYCEVLLKLYDAIRRKCPGQLTRGVCFIMTMLDPIQPKLSEHLPYSLDVAPTDFRLARRGGGETHFGGKRQG